MTLMLLYIGTLFDDAYVRGFVKRGSTYFERTLNLEAPNVQFKMFEKSSQLLPVYSKKLTK